MCLAACLQLAHGAFVGLFPCRRSSRILACWNPTESTFDPGDGVAFGCARSPSRLTRSWRSRPQAAFDLGDDAALVRSCHVFCLRGVFSRGGWGGGSPPPATMLGLQVWLAPHFCLPLRGMAPEAARRRAWFGRSNRRCLRLRRLSWLRVSGVCSASSRLAVLRRLWPCALGIGFRTCCEWGLDDLPAKV